MSNASSPPAQTEYEYVDYAPKGAAWELLNSTAPEVLLEGPAGTGKTRAVLEKINECCELYPGTRCLICRKTRTSLTESVLVTLERDILWIGHPALSGDASRTNRHSYDYPNKSTIVTGGLDKPERLYSTEWDLVYVAEATEITEDDWEKFARAMRHHVMPYQQRIADCNPGAPGHWLNQRAMSGKMQRLISHHVDNPSITPDYLAALRSLSGHRRARLYEGRWVSAEGSVFPEFTEDRNVCDDFPCGWPADWPVYIGYDSGYDHPAAVVFYGVGPTGQPFIFDEIHASGMTLDDLGPRLQAKLRGRNIVRMLADPRSVWSKTAQGNGVTIAEYMNKTFGLHFSPWPTAAGKEVENQVEAVRTLIRDPDKPLQVWRSCVRTVGEFQSWAYKRTADGSLPAGDDAFEDRNNDAMDAIRGIVASRPTFSGPSFSVSRRE